MKYINFELYKANFQPMFKWLFFLISISAFTFFGCQKPCPPIPKRQFVPLDSVFKSLILNQGKDTLIFTYNDLDTVVFYPEIHDSSVLKFEDTYPDEQCGYVGPRYAGEKHSYVYGSPTYNYKLIFIVYMDINKTMIECYVGQHSWKIFTKYVNFNKQATVNGHLFLNTHNYQTFTLDLYEGIVSFQTNNILWKRLL